MVLVKNLFETSKLLKNAGHFLHIIKKYEYEILFLIFFSITLKYFLKI